MLFHKSAVFRLLLGASLISLSPFFVEFSSLGAFANSFYRSAIGGFIFLCIALYRKERFPSFHIFSLCILAAFTISFDMILWNKSVLYIGAGLGTILANLEIIFMVLIGVIFFRERLNPLFWGMCLVIATGIYFLIQPYFSENHPHTSAGITLALAASFVFSIYLLLLKIIFSKKSDRHSFLMLLAIISLMSSIIIAIFMVFIPSTTFVIAHPQGLACVTLNGTLCQVFGWILITYGIENLHFSLSGLLLLTQPVLTFFLDGLFFQSQYSKFADCRMYYLVNRCVCDDTS